MILRLIFYLKISAFCFTFIYENIKNIFMIRICAWCEKELSGKNKNENDGIITHGICSECALKMTDFKPRAISTILNYIEEPVFIVDNTGTIQGANKSAQQMTGKTLEEIENNPGGNVFECTYSKNEGGCGNTVHCTACAVRNIVMDTLKTGKGYKSVPAFQSIDTPHGRRLLKFNISTEKNGEHILLRIDNASDTERLT